MSKEIKSYLSNIKFIELDNWSVQYLFETSFSYNDKYKLTNIGSFLIRNKTNINILDNENYKRVTIKINNGGIFLRNVEQGNNIGTKKQFIVKEGQFIVSKIDARNGAFGVIPNELNNAIITGNFWTFDVDHNLINPYFLSLITTTKEFILFCSNASNGTTNRHYLQEKAFLNVKIPLPTLKEQNELLEKYNTKILFAEEQDKESKQIKDNIEDFFNNEIGLVKKELKSKSKDLLKTINYTNVEKWGVDKLNTNQNISYIKNFTQKNIQSIATVSSGGTPSRSIKEYYTGKIPWIKTGEVVNDIILNTQEKITEEAIKNSSAKIYLKDSLIIAMYGQGLTRGRTARLGIDASTNQACAVLSNIDNDLINTDYLWFYLMNEYHRLRELASGNNQPNLNADMVKNYKVVIPPFDIQDKIVIEITKRNKEIKRLKKEALKNRENAIKEFEKEIFTV